MWFRAEYRTRWIGRQGEIVLLGLLAAALLAIALAVVQR